MDLAQSFGVAQTTIANYEKKLRFPDERMLGRFADFFGVSMDFLLGRSDSMRGPDEDTAEVRKEPAAPAAGLAAEYLDTLRRLGFEAAMQLVDTAFATGNSALVQEALSLSQGGYGKPNPGQEYFYLRVQMKDALGIVYFSPAITAMMNLQDRSYQVTPELQYTGIKNLELRARLFLLEGGSSTDFGEKQNSRKLEFYARYYF
jgi:transcriptional regulator with XRE-family HTH domain